MKLLLISDRESEYLWDYYQPGHLDGIDLILSCGDLHSQYLSFLVTMGSAPLLYVHGNHDKTYDQHPPEGCRCVEDSLVTVQGLRILGLGGSILYSGGPHQYTERQMKRRISKLARSMRREGVDILVTHSPAQGLGDMDDPCHRGFACFRELMDKYTPRYLVHGHVHLQYAPDFPRIREYGDTTIVNASGKYFIELPDRPCEVRPQGGLRGWLARHVG